MRSRRRRPRGSTSGDRYGFVRFQQSTARIALAEGKVEVAATALRTMAATDFEDPSAARECLAIVRDPGATADRLESAVRGLSRLAPRA